MQGGRETYLEDLNEQQRVAVRKTDGPLLVLAGAGAGKTRVITYRILHLIHRGVAPQNILAVTFTNKAAREMAERVENMLRKDRILNLPIASAARPYIATFHGLCVQILRRHAGPADVPTRFTIYDRNDSIRAIKAAMRDSGIDPKRFEPRTLLGTISRAKGDGMTLGEYAEGAGEFYPRIVARVWERYDALLRKERALDFDDLLLRAMLLLERHEDVRAHYEKRFTHVHVDEYQDTNAVQYKIMKLLVGEKMNVCVVGDIDQCLAAGTKVTMADGSTKLIESIRSGDEVLSNYGSGDMRPAHVSKIFSRNYREELVRITTMAEREIVSTPEHTHFAGYRLGTAPQLYFTYLMFKRGIGYRLGTSQVYTKGQQKPTVGFIQRSQQEHADSVWVLDVCRTPNEARALEYKLSLQYQIPTLPFVARKGTSVSGYVHDQQAIDKIFTTFDTQTSAVALLQKYKLSLHHPHHHAQSRNSNRRNLRVTLCGDRRGKTPMHRVTMVGNDTAGRHALRTAGFSVRPAKAASTSWRFETAHADFGAVQKIIQRIQKALPETGVYFSARLGKTRHDEIRSGNSLPFVPATSVRVGMSLFNEEGEYDTVTRVETIPPHTTKVYDLNVEHTHNFIANGIVTHNCIYSWRGANLDNLLQFEKTFPGTTVIVLEQNYRSTKTILDASNAVIEKNVKRKEKRLFTENNQGEPIAIAGCYDEEDEARFVAGRAGELISRGTAPREIAVLYRANFQSRALEEAFLAKDIPYQVLGVRFFERREVKDVLAFIRLARNPENSADLTRVINVPPRGIGKVTLLKMIEGREGELTSAMQKRVEAFKTLLSRIRKAAETMPPSEVIKIVLRETGMEEYFSQGGDEEHERLENVRELVTLARRYDVFPPEEAIEKLLEDAALASEQDELREERNAVRLMTVHAAKGLEFDYVFITGLEEGLFPHEGFDEDRDEEEERRLFYVALTRARKKVFLAFASVRTIFGSRNATVPSSFIHDIDEKLLEVADPTADSTEEKTITID